MNSLLNSQVLVLNRLWQAVNICTARRAFALVYAGHAHVVSSDNANNFLTHDFDSWRDFSSNAPDHELVTTMYANVSLYHGRDGKRHVRSYYDLLREIAKLNGGDTSKILARLAPREQN